MFSIKLSSYIYNANLYRGAGVVLFFMFSHISYAASCSSTLGAPYIYTFNTTFGQAQNTVGYNTGPITRSAPGSWSIGPPCTAKETTYYSAVAGPRLQIATNDGNDQWYDISDHDYLQIASKIAVWNANSGTTRQYSVPFNNISNDCNSRPDACGGSATTGSTVSISLKIKKRFVGNAYISGLKIFTLYGNNTFGGGFGQGLSEGILNATLSVPQSCELNTGDIIVINLGPISSGSFTTAGTPSLGFSPVTRSIGIKCDNIDTSAALTLRLEASNVSGSFLKSNNPDVGFAVTDTLGNLLVPNVFSSRLNFLLQDGQANVDFQVYPVSTTGIRPQEGPVTSEAFLRIDFP
ncbi:fimbrial protein [Providencia sp. Je.9.19]|uniref:fimbrial protein n=1 Tax=Providencia sp. Je.9.19 TaxID=3142844 RepID=UPI003DA9AFFC